MTTASDIGVYLGWPDSTTYNALLGQFENTVGVAPSYVDTFINYDLPMSAWAQNALASATGLANSAGGLATIPVVGLPLSTADRDGKTALQVFNAIASGADDSIWTGIVDAYKSKGFTTIALRIGWEMNGTWQPWAVNTEADAAGYIAAFRHIATLVHNIAGITVQTVWNPAITGSTPVATEATYPGDAYVDIVGADLYSTLDPVSLYDWSTHKVDATAAIWDANPVNQEHYWDYPAASQYTATGGTRGWGLVEALAFAKAHNKPFALPETGAGGTGGTTGPYDNAVFPEYLAARLLAAGAPKTAFVNIWDSGALVFSNGARPKEAAAWASFAKQMIAALTPTPATPTTGTSTLEGTVHHYGSADPVWGTAQSDVTVALVNAAGAVVATTVTNGGGWFEFSKLAAGSYRVRYAPPTGEALSPTGAAAVQTALSAPVTLGAGQTLWAASEAVVSSSNTFVLDGVGATALRDDGSDVVSGDASSSTLTLGAGNQHVTLTGAGNTVTTGTGNQVISLAGTGNTVTVGVGTSVINAGAGDAMVHAAAGGWASITATGPGNVFDGHGVSFLNADGSANNIFMLNAAGQGLATISGFNAAAHDVLNLARTLAGTGIEASLANIGSYVTAQVSGGNTLLFVSPAGYGARTEFAVLDGVNTSVSALVAAHDIAG